MSKVQCSIPGAILQWALRLLSVFALAAWTPAAAQTISVDSVPPYKSLGFITGSTSGIDPNTHHVAVYIQIEGAGWWTKPTSMNPTVPIDASGNFVANVGTGGGGSLDSRATIFCAALLPDSVAPPVAAGAGRIPASLAPLAIDCHERFGRIISFAGFDWAVKESNLPAGPGPNLFSDRVEDVFVDEDGLHLRIAEVAGVWVSTEVILLSHMGYGTYSVQTDSELDDLDVSSVFGVFLWDSYGDDDRVPGGPNREIDFEDSRWMNALDPTNAQMVVQPYTNPDNLRRYTIPDLASDSALTRFFTWLPGSIHFVALRGHHSPLSFPGNDVIDEYVYLHAPPANHVPSQGRERLRLNLWLNGGAPQPAGGQPVEVVVTDVVFLPEPSRELLIFSGTLLLCLLARGRRARAGGSATPPCLARGA
jgi:hypothetical protein